MLIRDLKQREFCLRHQYLYFVFQYLAIISLKWCAFFLLGDACLNFAIMKSLDTSLFIFLEKQVRIWSLRSKQYHCWNQRRYFSSSLKVLAKWQGTTSILMYFIAHAAHMQSSILKSFPRRFSCHYWVLNRQEELVLISWWILFTGWSVVCRLLMEISRYGTYDRTVCIPNTVCICYLLAVL